MPLLKRSTKSGLYFYVCFYLRPLLRWVGMRQKRWRFNTPNPEVVSFLMQKIKISEPIANILALRNINTFEEAERFFNSDLKNLYDPFLMDGMDAATDRIISAINNDEKICIYGDYDVDGTCSAAVLYLFLKDIKADVFYYIPNRMTEGYGISNSGIDIAAEKGAKLIISVDCGITAIEPVEYAKSKNIDVIISDHHNPKDILPDAYTVLDPLKPGCNYPAKILSGAGVAFKIADAITKKLKLGNIHYQYLDLVAIAAAADIVPMVDENRILVNEGIKLINSNPRPGLKALIEISGLNRNNGQANNRLNSSQIVFILAPRINAVGRLGSAERAVKLLIAKDMTEANSHAKVLEEENKKRRSEDLKTLTDAEALVNANSNFGTEKTIVLHQDEWHQGVVGIVASRLVEKFYRPTVMLTTVDGIAKGSARSVPNFNIYNALKECEDLLIHFGGHQAAAGLAIEIENIDKFREKFNKIVTETINEEDLSPEISIDTEIKLAKITEKFYNILVRMQPFGPGNMKPVFCAKDVSVVYNPRCFKDIHLGLVVKQDGTVMDCVGWNMGFYCKQINVNSKLDIIFTIDRQQNNKIQLILKDLKIN